MADASISPISSLQRVGLICAMICAVACAESVSPGTAAFPSDVTNADSSMDADTSSDAGLDLGFDAAKRVVPCSELMSFFQCSRGFRECFAADPSGDRGPCDSPGQYCENWDNCRGLDFGVVDWDCLCVAFPGQPPRWRCVVEAVCDAGRVDANAATD